MIDLPLPEVLDADELYYMALPPIKYYIDGLLPQGLTVIASAPKGGKSYMCLSILIALAEGVPIWGRNTIQCESIYYCLEDTYIRIQSRLHQLTDEPPPGIHLIRECEPIGSGLEEELKRLLQRYPNVGVVVIDTLQRVRSMHRTTSNQYAADYADLTAIKAIADEYNIGIICVHHNRKNRSGDDPLADVSGTFGVVGAADAIWAVRKHHRYDSRATVYVSGRDVAQQQLTMSYDDGIWKLISDDAQETADVNQVPEIIYRIIDYVIMCREWSGTSSELVDAIGVTEIKPSAIGKMLVKYADTILLDAGISYTTVRTKSQRIIKLEYMNDR